jgi:hypothetical protein
MTTNTLAGSTNKRCQLARTLRVDLSYSTASRDSSETVRGSVVRMAWQ